jgi:hypothetical protein
MELLKLCTIKEGADGGSSAWLNELKDSYCLEGLRVEKLGLAVS